MKRRLHFSALLLGTSFALVSHAARAQEAPGEGPAEGEKPAGEQPPSAPAPEQKPAEAPAVEAPAPAPGEGQAPGSEPGAAPAEAPATTPAPTEQTPAPTEQTPPAPAAEAQGTGTAAAGAEASTAVAEPAPEELVEAGYIPGYRRIPTLGLSPFHPRVPGLTGGMTIPPYAPAAADEWSFNYSGYFSAAVKAAIANRALPAREGQSETVLKTPPVLADCYGCFNGTGGVLGSWVSFNLEYGNQTTTAHVSMSTWNPSRPASYTQISSQYFIGDAFLTFRAPQIDKLRLFWAIGAFTVNYGQLGQYSNLYGSTFLGSTTGVGELLLAEYDLTDTLVLQAEHGFFGRYGRAPLGIPENQASGWPDPQDPAPWSQVARLGVVRSVENGSIQAGVVFMSNWAHDDTAREAVDDRDRTDSAGNPAAPPLAEQTPWDESNPNDPGLQMIGLETRIRGLWYHFGLAAGLVDIDDAWNLHGTTFWVAGDGENMTNNWVGVESGGNGSMWGVGTEFRVGWGALARVPEPFYGEGWNAESAIAVQFGSVDSDGPNSARDIGMYKFGVDNRVKPIKWVAAGFRFDRVVPNTEHTETAFWTISPRLEFQTNWNSHETITLQYAHWFYGDEPPFINSNTQNTNLDSDVVSFGFGMWW